MTIGILEKENPKTAKFRKSMLKVRNFLLTCLYQKDIPPDNNSSERAIRNVKVKQKISGQFKTGQNVFCILRSIIDTARKRGKNILDILKLIMLGGNKMAPE